MPLTYLFRISRFREIFYDISDLCVLLIGHAMFLFASEYNKDSEIQFNFLIVLLQARRILHTSCCSRLDVHES